MEATEPRAAATVAWPWWQQEDAAAAGGAEAEARSKQHGYSMHACITEIQGIKQASVATSGGREGRVVDAVSSGQGHWASIDFMARHGRA